MDLIINFLDFFIHLDKYLQLIIQSFGIWAYVIIFLVIFCETGLVVTPILPGDSLLFALGAFAAQGALNIEILLISLCSAAIAGDTVNYSVGKFLGPKVFSLSGQPLFQKGISSADASVFTKNTAVKQSSLPGLFPLSVLSLLLWLASAR